MLVVWFQEELFALSPQQLAVGTHDPAFVFSYLKACVCLLCILQLYSVGLWMKWGPILAERSLAPWRPKSKVVVLNWGDFCNPPPPPQGSLDEAWRYFWLFQLREGGGAQASSGQGCCQTSYNTQDSVQQQPPQPQTPPVPSLGNPRLSRVTSGAKGPPRSSLWCSSHRNSLKTLYMFLKALVILLTGSVTGWEKFLSSRNCMFKYKIRLALIREAERWKWLTYQP